MSDTSKHADALRKVRIHGAAVTLTRELPGVYDPIAETHTSPSEETIAGYAAEIPDDSEAYAVYALVPAATKMLLFVPNTIGAQPVLNSTLFWDGVKRTIAAIMPIQPSGVMIAAKLFVQ